MLFELLHSLGKQEKRYLRVALKRSAVCGRSRYLELFDLVLKNPGVDDSLMRRNFSGKNYEVAKHQLYEWVLRHLCSFHSGESTDSYLADRIRQVQLLMDKKLHRQGAKLVARSLKVALLHERNLKALELLELELRCLHAGVEVEQIREKSAAYFELKEELMKRESQLSLLRKLSYENFVQLKTQWVGRETGEEKKRSPFEHIREEDLLSVNASILFYQNLSAYYFSVNEAEHALEQLVKLDNIFTSNPHLIADHLDQYVACLNNMNLINMNRGEFDVVMKNVGKMRSLPMPSAERRMRIMERVVNAEINVHKNKGTFSEAGPIISEVHDLLGNKKLSEVYRMLFNIELFNYYFAIREYRSALKFLNYFLIGSRASLRPDLQRTARLLNLIAHYKLGNYDFFESLLRSTARYFRSRGWEDEMTAAFLGFFPRLILATSKPVRKELFREFEATLKAISEKGLLYETYFRNFNFMQWVKEEASL